MSVININKTSATPTTTSSEAYVAHKDLGPRPICVTCDDISECTTCAGDAPYSQPVVSGDLVYLQYRFSDLFNLDPMSPVYGWEGEVSGASWIEAALVFPTSDTEVDIAGTSMIAGQEVGYFNGSYQNLILNTAAIMDYINSEILPDKCFQVKITTYKYDYPPYSVIMGLFPSAPSTDQPEGTIYYNSSTDLFYRIVGGVWTSYTMDNEFIFSIRDGGWYTWNDIVLVPGAEPTLTKIQYEQCLSRIYQFVPCDTILTVSVEGYHGESDCRGYYYGGEVRFRDRYRLWASFESVGFRTEKEVNENEEVTSFTQYEEWLLRITKGTPYPELERLANTLTGSQVFFDNNEYLNISDPKKNNENGFNWWSQITADRLKCEKDTGCADEIFANPIVICPEPNPETVGEPVHLVGELGDYDAYAVCGTTFEVPAATVEDQDGNVLGQVDAGETLVVTCGDPSGGGSPVLVHNSDDSYSETVPCGNELLLDDYTINVIQDGVTVETVTVPAMTDVTINIEWV